MSKKSKIIMWVIIALLVIAVIVVVIVTSLDRGTQLNDLTKFDKYVENYSYAQRLTAKWWWRGKTSRSILTVTAALRRLCPQAR